MSPIDGVTGAAAGVSPAPPPGGGLLPTVYSNAFTRYVGPPGFLRLDITISGGDAYLQISEWVEKGHWDPEVGSEFLVQQGSHSIPLVRPAYQWRVRSASTTAGVSVNARTIG